MIHTSLWRDAASRCMLCSVKYCSCRFICASRTLTGAITCVSVTAPVLGVPRTNPTFSTLAAMPAADSIAESYKYHVRVGKIKLDKCACKMPIYAFLRLSADVAANKNRAMRETIAASLVLKMLLFSR